MHRGQGEASSIWPVLITALGLLASLAWSGFLSWVVYRTVVLL